MRKRSMTGLLCVVGALFAVSAFAVQSENGGWFRRRAAGMFVRRIEMQLSLTAKQREQIRSIFKTEKPAIETLTARLQRERNELNSRPNFDETWVKTYAQEHASTARDVLVEREKVRYEIMEVLTPAQRAKAEQLRETLLIQLTDRLERIGDDL